MRAVCPPELTGPKVDGLGAAAAVAAERVEVRRPLLDAGRAAPQLSVVLDELVGVVPDRGVDVSCIRRDRDDSSNRRYGAGNAICSDVSIRETSFAVTSASPLHAGSEVRGDSSLRVFMRRARASRRAARPPTSFRPLPTRERCTSGRWRLISSFAQRAPRAPIRLESSLACWLPRSEWSSGCRSDGRLNRGRGRWLRHARLAASFSDAPSLSRASSGLRKRNAFFRILIVRDSSGVPLHATPSSVPGSRSANFRSVTIDLEVIRSCPSTP